MSLGCQTILITGANRGLGEAIARKLLAEGAHVVLAARDAAALETVENQLRMQRVSRDQQVLARRTDVSNPNEVHDLVQCALGVDGRIDGLVCNAGVYGPMGRVEEVDWSEWVAAIEVNLLGTVLCCREVLPVMRAQDRGKIVVLSGGGATQPLPRLSAYAASKAAVVRFAETLAEETRDTAITVNAVAPGALNTRLLDQVIAAGPERVGQAFYDRALAQSAKGGTPLELPAELVAFLLSHASDGVSGRLLSAPWDDWRNLPNRREQLAKSDVYTLRRIVPEDRGWTAQ